MILKSVCVRLHIPLSPSTLHHLHLKNCKKIKRLGGGEYFLIYFLDEKTVFVHMTMLGDEIKRIVYFYF